MQFAPTIDRWSGFETTTLPKKILFVKNFLRISRFNKQKSALKMPTG